MKFRSTSASATLTRHEDDRDHATEALAPSLTIDRPASARPVRTRPSLTLAAAPAWKHRLVLTGSLDHRTVIELEEEIECLCEEGVTTLTLDLRRIDAIDAAGARAIACGGAMCKKRGRDFAVVAGSPAVHRALAEAGAEGMLVGDAREAGALAVAADASASSRRDTSTVMLKSL